jgi:hypothetical protein
MSINTLSKTTLIMIKTHYIAINITTLKSITLGTTTFITLTLSTPALNMTRLSIRNST